MYVWLQSYMHRIGFREAVHITKSSIQLTSSLMTCGLERENRHEVQT